MRVQPLMANTFIECMHPWGNNQNERVAVLQRRIDDFQKTNKGTAKLQGKLTFERLRTGGDWPKLRAKAACTRHLSRFALLLAVEADNALPADAPADVKLHSRRRRAVNQTLVRFYEILDEHDRFFPEDALVELERIGRTLLVVYTQLSAEARNNQRRMWKLIPKVHLFDHICCIAVRVWGNPKKYWTYSDEDLQKLMKTIALSCHTSTMAESGLLKWITSTFD